MKMPEPDDYGQGYFDDGSRYRALELLWQHLTEEQRAEYVETKTVVVRGEETGDCYRIYRGTVRRVVDGSDFCLVVRDNKDNVPVEDMVLAKKILLECDEDTFLRTARLLRPI